MQLNEKLHIIKRSVIFMFFTGLFTYFYIILSTIVHEIWHLLLMKFYWYSGKIYITFWEYGAVWGYVTNDSWYINFELLEWILILWAWIFSELILTIITIFILVKYKNKDNDIFFYFYKNLFIFFSILIFIYSLQRNILEDISRNDLINWEKTKIYTDWWQIRNLLKEKLNTN